MKYISNLFYFVTLLFIVSMCLACGGGTTGTGDAQTYEGRITTTNNEPLENVFITVVETGDTDFTDASGAFSIPTGVTSPIVNLKIEGKGISATYQVKTTVVDNSKIYVDIKINASNSEVKVSEYAAQVGMVGACDRYFENNDVIRQANKVLVGTVCTLKVVLYGDGTLQSDLPVALQVRGCDPFTQWRTLQLANTGVGIKRGVVQIPFEYKSTKAFCEYRVLAPVNIVDRTPLDYRIHTFRYQELKTQ